MRSPKVGKPRVARTTVSLSRTLPKLSITALPASTSRPRPQVNRPPKPIAAQLTTPRKK
ncbi:MAG TPA: hypothetical protein VGF48_14780 [Thermoanaerobaculia bacterium]